jgi:hypothetical protein
MISRIIAGTIVCFFAFNAMVIKFVSVESFIKASLASFVIGPILGFLAYKSQKASQKQSK